MTPGFVERVPLAYAMLRDTLVHTDREGYAANCEAINATDLRDEARSITSPTLVIAGTHDPSTPAEQGKALADSIIGSRYVELGASHLSNIEVADQYTKTALQFLTAP